MDEPAPKMTREEAERKLPFATIVLDVITDYMAEQQREYDARAEDAEPQ